MKKTLCKIVSALTAFCLIFGTVSLAAPVTSGGNGTDYSYYWSQDFNDLPESGIKAVRVANSATVSRVGTEGDYALNIAAAASNSMAIIDNNAAVETPIPKFDFSKGPMVLSYDVTINELNKAVFYMMFRSSENAAADLFGSIRIERSGRIAGFKKKDTVSTDYATSSADLTQVNAARTTTAGTVNHIQNVFIYDNENKILTVKYFLNGEQLMQQNDTSVPLEIKYKADNMDTLMSGDMFMRFTVAGAGGSVKLDNIMLRSEGTVNIDDVGYISQGDTRANVTFTDTAEYDPNNKPSDYQKAVNKIPASQTVLSGDNEYYTLTKYDATDNPLLLKAGTPAESKVGWKGNGGMAVSGLDIANDKEFYILKLKSPSAIMSFAGVEPENMYSCLRRAVLGEGAIAARETSIIGENNAEITLDEEGRLPANAKAIRFVTASNLTLTEENVKMTGADGKEFAGEQSSDTPNVWTINITEPLTEGTEYTVTLGDFSQKVTTTGEEPPSSDAAVTSGGKGTEYGYYWNQNFNALPEDMSKEKAARKFNADLTRASISDGDYALDVTATGNSAFAIIDNNKAVTKPLPKFDFSKGPMVLSFDITMNNLTSPFYLMLRSSEDANTDMLGIVRIQNTGRICGYTKKADLATDYAAKAADLSYIASNTIAKTGTTYHIQTALIYDEASKVLTVKQYLNGEPMTLQGTNTPIEYQYQAADKNTMDALLSGDMFLRFSVPTKEGSVRIDNIMLRSEGTMDMDDVGYISQGDTRANVTFTDTAEYDPDNKPSDYPKTANKIPASQTVLSGDNEYYTLTKYNAADNPLLLKAGTPAESKVGWKGNGGMAVSGLDIANDKEFYILKLKSPSAVTSFAGAEPENVYSCLRRAALGEGAIAARETTILDGDGNELTLDARDRLPASAKTIKFVTSKYAELTADKVKMVGTDGKEFTGVQSQTEPNVWTINIDELSELTDYTITLGDFSQTVRTDGYDPNAFYWYEGFDSYDGNSLPDGFTQPGTGISFTKTEISGSSALKYVNEYIPETSGTSRFSIESAEPLDFSKGALLLSYDVTPQSNLTYLGDGAKSNILIPSLRVGNTEVSQLSIIEHGGIKAAYKTASNAWTRSAYLSDWANNSLVADTTVKFQLLLEKEGNQITATQYVNGKPAYYTSADETKLASLTADVAESELMKGWSLVFAGRRFPNGLVFDNLHITTVGGIRANDAITIADNAVTAQIALENTLQFAENAPSAVKEIKMQNTAASSDFKIKKYNTADDPLLLNGETVSGFDLNNMGETLVLSRLPERKNGEIFIIELPDASKIQTLVGKTIDTTVFRAGANPNGLKKTRLLDSEGDEVRAENKIVPSALSKIELSFTNDTKLDTLPVITNTEKNYSLTAVLGEDGIYRFDFTGDNATLSPNTVYTVTYGDTSAQFTTGGGIVQAAAPVIDADGKASAVITNTSETAANVYIISAYYNSEEDIVSAVKYEKFTVDAGKTENISMSEAHSAPAEWAEQRVFIWDGFEKMNPYCAYGSRKNQ